MRFTRPWMHQKESETFQIQISPLYVLTEIPAMCGDTNKECFQFYKADFGCFFILSLLPVSNARMIDYAKSYGVGIPWMKIVWWQQLLPNQTPEFYITSKRIFKCLSLYYNQHTVAVKGIILGSASSSPVCFLEDM